MGWLFFRKPQDVKGYLDNQFANNGAQRVLKSAIVARGEYYAAVDVAKPGEPPRVLCVVCLLKFVPRASDGYTFGHKDMDETAGPYVNRCPEGILDLLTEPFNEYAATFRERCRAYHARVRNHPKPGQRVKLAAPCRFTNGATLDTFTVVKMGRKLRYRAPDGLLYRLGKDIGAFTVLEG